MRNNNGANILVVDDEEGMRLGLTKILEKEGYRVTTAANGEKALNLMERISFDLVISDLKMPKYSGIELLKTINKINTGSPLIIITAYASLESAIEAIKEKADDYLVKPFGREELISTVRRVIEKRKKEEETIKTLDEREHQLKSLLDFTKKFVVMHSFKDTISYMLESAIDFASAKAAAIWVRSKEDDSLTFIKGLHIFGLPSEKKPLKIGDGYTGKAALTKEVIAVADLVKKPDTEHRKAVQNFKIKSLFSIPIKINEELIGVLNIYTQDKRKVSEEEIELFKKWGETAAVILNSVIINKKENLH